MQRGWNGIWFVLILILNDEICIEIRQLVVIIVFLKLFELRSMVRNTLT